MKNRYELNESNEIIRNDSGTCTALTYFETDDNLNELFSYGIAKYIIIDGQLTERTEAEILDLLDANSELKEVYRKAYCQREIRKLYDDDKEFQLQRKGILDSNDTEFLEYSAAI